MKKYICCILVGILIGSLTIVCANQAIQAIQNDQIKISLNGQIQTFKDETTGETQYPITYNDRTYLPLRNVAQLSGLNVDYDSKSNTAILAKNNKYTDKQLIELAKAYSNVTTGYVPSFVEIDSNNYNKAVIHLYDIVDEHAATSNWYTVDPYSGRGYDLLENEIDISYDGIIRIINAKNKSKEGLQYVNLNGLNANRLEELFEVSKLENDKEELIAYTTIGDKNYDVYYRKEMVTEKDPDHIYVYDGLFEYIILKNGDKKLELLINTESDTDYIEKIFTLHNGEVLGVATFNRIGDANQTITLYDCNLNFIKDSEGRDHDFNYADWRVELGYEHQYGIKLDNDTLIFYINDDENAEKITYEVELEKGDGSLYEYVYSLKEISRTKDGYIRGAGRT